jgi:hypothetical protein
MRTRRRVRENNENRNSENYSPLRLGKEKVEDLVAFECSLQPFKEGVKVNLLITRMQFFDTLQS